MTDAGRHLKAAVFLTTRPEAGVELLDRLTAEHGDARWSVFVRDDDRGELEGRLQGMDVRRDKAPGGRLAFLKALRRERFDLLVVAWHGGDRSYPLKLAAPFCGARRTVGIDERGRAVPFSLLWPVPMLIHLVRRPFTSKPDPARLARIPLALYRRTIGLVLGGSWVLLRFAGWQLLRRRH